jgi:hypothetical protein
MAAAVTVTTRLLQSSCCSFPWQVSPLPGNDARADRELLCGAQGKGDVQVDDSDGEPAAPPSVPRYHTKTRRGSAVASPPLRQQLHLLAADSFRIKVSCCRSKAVVEVLDARYTHHHTLWASSSMPNQYLRSLYISRCEM